MAFKLPTKTSTDFKDPETLFRDLNDRKVEGLHSQQADMLRAYMEHIDHQDVALELPTGSGKTLVGLLIAEWRRRVKKERCLMLCPTRQLVNQVVEQAKEKYGIQALNFTGSKHDFSEADKTAFNNCETIGVTTYSALFNVSPFFNDVHTIIFDDAHAAENYVSSMWSLKVHRSEDLNLYDSIWQVIASYTPENDQLRLNQDSEVEIDHSSVNKLATPYLLECKNQLTIALDQANDSNEGYRYVWEKIRDHLHACHLYYTTYSILIRPLIAPTESFAPFQNAKHRVYMSATLGEGGELERTFGRKRITRIPAPEGWDKQGVGRRYFVFPMRNMDETESLDLATNWAKKFGRALVLTKSNRDADIVKNAIKENSEMGHYKIFDAGHLEQSKSIFIQENSAFAILANRYDGIDLIGDECRYLVVYGLPDFIDLQERFISTRMGASLLFDVRLRTRITQAVGRCTRSSIDYACVVIIGDKIHQYFHKPEKRKLLHPEFQSESEFGVEQSKVDDPTDLGNNIDIFLRQDEEWKSVNDYIVDSRNNLTQSPIQFEEQLQDSVLHEVDFQNSLWNNDFDNALTHAKDVLARISGGDELKGYRALWNYLAGSTALQANNKQLAVNHFSDALSCTASLPWLRQVQKSISEQSSEVTIDLNNAGEQIESIEVIFEKFGKSSSLKIDKHVQSIKEGLSSTDSGPFEQAQVKLGILLGFQSQSSKASGASDPWWIFGQKGIVFEDYTETGTNPVISKRKVQQAKGHPDTLSVNYPGIEFSVVICSTSNKLDHAAVPHTNDIYYISKLDFIAFANESIPILRELWASFSSSGDINWRETAIQKLAGSSLDIDSIFTRLTNTKLSSLPSIRVK